MSYCANNVVTVLSNISTNVILYRFIIVKVRIVKEDLVHTSLESGWSQGKIFILQPVEKWLLEVAG